MSISDHKNWKIVDNFLSENVKSIELISERLKIMYSRVSNREKLSISPLNIFSVIFRIEALEYHYSRFKDLIKNLAPNFKSLKPKNLQETSRLRMAQFEAMAYINTVGWLYHWACSRKAKPEKITKIAKSFRAKNTAHLSMHYPHKETLRELELHSLVFIGALWNGNGELLFQIQKTAGHSIEFNLLREHKDILKEVEIIFEDMLKM